MSKTVKLRAVIYCRVSTQEQMQKDALKVQVEEAKRCVRENRWQLVGEYIEMESGTTKSGRTEYMRLLSDMHVPAGMSRGFDVIVIKSLDRLNRCAKNWYLFVDELVRCDKRLYIYMDRAFYRTDDNLLAGIKAILAEQYSRDLSRKVSAAHAYRQKNGTTVLLNNNTYGYRKNADKTVSVEDSEAEMVRQIYSLAAQGRGAYSISNLLFEQGIRNRNGKQLGESTIRRIVRNPLYKGVVVMNRKHFDFERKKRVENPPSEWIVHEGLVPAIVEEGLWERANQRMGCLSGKVKKSQRISGQSASDGMTGCSENDKQNHRKRQKEKKNSPKVLYDFSGKIVCGVCGEPYYKTFRWRGKNKQEKVVEWKCSRYLKHGRKGEYGCDNIFLGQEKLKVKMEEEAERYLSSLDKAVMEEWIEGILEAVFTQEERMEKVKYMSEVSSEKMLEKRKESLEKKQKRLLELLLEDVISKYVYQQKICELQKEESDVKKQLQKWQKDFVGKEEQNVDVRDMHLEEQLEKKQGDLGEKEGRGIREIKEKLLQEGIQRIKTVFFLLKIQKIQVKKEWLNIRFFDRDSFKIVSVKMKK